MSGASFTRECLEEVMAYAISIPKQPVGIVCRPHLYEQLRQQSHDVGNTANLFGNSAFNGLPVFMDGRQEAEAIAFYDHNLLKLYLARHDNNDAMLAWVKAYVASQTQVTTPR